MAALHKSGDRFRSWAASRGNHQIIVGNFLSVRHKHNALLALYPFGIADNQFDVAAEHTLFGTMRIFGYSLVKCHVEKKRLVHVGVRFINHSNLDFTPQNLRL